tara:strand:+ start:737 stop:1354 length:618 start_codon:yes stop_codon:yes gene_type:complete
MIFVEEYKLPDEVANGVYKLCKDAKHHGYLLPGQVGTEGRVVPEAKLCSEIPLTSLPPHFFTEEHDRSLQGYQDEIYQMIQHYARKYMDESQLTPTNPPKIQWYDPGEAYFAEHYDNGFLHSEKQVAYITYLTDNVDGGGTRFVHQDYTVKSEFGKTVFFPAGYTHRHQGVVDNKDVKIILTGWFKYFIDPMIMNQMSPPMPPMV